MNEISIRAKAQCVDCGAGIQEGDEYYEYRDAFDGCMCDICFDNFLKELKRNCVKIAEAKIDE